MFRSATWAGVSLTLVALVCACSNGPTRDARAACAVVFQLQVQLVGPKAGANEAIALPDSFRRQLEQSGDQRLAAVAGELAPPPDRATLTTLDLGMSAECYRLGIHHTG